MTATVFELTTPTEMAPETPAYSPAAPLATILNTSSRLVASTKSPLTLVFASSSLPVKAVIEETPAAPNALMVVPLPTLASVFLVMELTPMAAPTPATPIPAAAAPATRLTSVSSLAATCALPPASTRVIPPTTVARVVLLNDTTATEPATATLPAAERPMPKSSVCSRPRASTSTFWAAFTFAPAPTAATVLLVLTSTSAPAPIATAPATEAAPARPR